MAFCTALFGQTVAFKNVNVIPMDREGWFQRFDEDKGRLAHDSRPLITILLYLHGNKLGTRN